MGRAEAGRGPGSRGERSAFGDSPRKTWSPDLCSLTPWAPSCLPLRVGGVSHPAAPSGIPRNVKKHLQPSVSDGSLEGRDRGGDAFLKVWVRGTIRDYEMEARLPPAAHILRQPRPRAAELETDLSMGPWVYYLTSLCLNTHIGKTG